MVGLLEINDKYLNDFLYTIKNYDKNNHKVFSNGENINKYLEYISSIMLPNEFKNIKNEYLQNLQDKSQDILDYIKEFSYDEFYFRLFKDQEVNDKFNSHSRSKDIDYDLEL